MRKQLSILILLIPLLSLRAQSVDSTPGLSLSVGAGLFPQFLSYEYHFESYAVSSVLKTSAFGTAGISYGSIRLTGMTVMMLSLEATIGQTSTPTFAFRSGKTARMSQTLFFLGASVKIIVESDLAPFIKGGVGTLWQRLREYYTNSNPLDEYFFKSTRLALAGGAGLDWKLSNSIMLSFCGEAFAAPDTPLLSFATLGVRSSFKL